MAVSYRISASRINTIAEGCITFKDFHTHLLARSRDDRIGAGLSELIDATNVTSVAFSAIDIPDLVQCQKDHADLFHPIPLAIVATEPLAFGFARSFERLTGPSNRLIAVFATRSEAEVWLDTTVGMPDEHVSDRPVHGGKSPTRLDS